MGKNYVLDAEMGVIGADFNPSEAPNIYHMSTPTFPQYHFEWHPLNETVYVIRRGSNPEIAEPIVDKVRDQGTAEKVVMIWCQGYHSGEHGRLLGQPVITPSNFVY